MEADVQRRVELPTLVVHNEWWVLQCQCPCQADALVDVVQEAGTRPQ